MRETLVLRLLQGILAVLFVVFTLPLLLSETPSIGWWLMQVLPLLLILPQLHKPLRRPLQWLGFLVLFYFTAGVLQMFSIDTFQRWSGALTVLGCCLLFALAIVRLRQLRSYKEE